MKAGKNIMFEAQLGALRDIDFGIYPVHLLLLHDRGLRAGRLRACPAPSWTAWSAS